MSQTNINETMINPMEDLIENNKDAVEKRKQSRCKRICRPILRFSLIEYRVGILETEENVYRPLWARLLSWIIVSGLVGYVVRVYSHLFKEILDVNTYSMGYDKEMIGNATFSIDRNLWPWKFDSSSFCPDYDLLYTIFDFEGQIVRDN